MDSVTGKARKWHKHYKIHARGPVGMEGLLIYKYVLIGKGDKVADYVGKSARKFTHKKLSLSLADKWMASDERIDRKELFRT